MNADFPQNEREQLEAKLTALLLGELPADEAIAMGKAMERDPKLAALYEQLKATIGLVRESAAHPAAETAAQAEPLKLSDERREKLLAQFKTIAPKEFEKSPRKGIRLLELAAVLVIAGFLAAMLLPSLSRSKSRAMSASVRNNLRLLDGAKQQWAVENNKSGDAEPTMEDLKVYLGRDSERLPSIGGEKYVPGKVSESPVAELSPSQAKRLLSKKDLTTAERRNGKVEYSLDGPVVTGPVTSTLTLVSRAPSRNQGVSQYSFGLNPASPLSSTAPPVPKTEIVLPAGSQFAVNNSGAAIVYGVTTTNGQSGHGFALIGPASQMPPPDSSENNFINRYAYVPPGQTLDIAAIHDQTRGANTDAIQLNYAAASDISGALAKLENTNQIAGAAGKFDDKTPLLGDVPALGKLFRSESKLADSDGKFDTGLTRDDMGGLRHMATNGTVALQTTYANANAVEMLNLSDSGGESNQKTEIVLRNQQSVLAGHPTIVGNGGSMPTGGFGGGGGAGGETFTPAKPVMVWGGKQVEIAAAANAQEKLKAPDVTVNTKFVDVNQNSNRAAGFAWYADNFQRTNVVPPSATDGLLTGGLRLPAEMPAQERAIQTSQLVQDGKLLYQLGKLDEADSKMKEALNRDPNNQAAIYYDSLVKQSRVRQVVDARNVTSMNRMVSTENGWVDNPARKRLPVPSSQQSEPSNHIYSAKVVGHVAGITNTPETVTTPAIDFKASTGVPLETDTALPKSAVPPPTPQPEILTGENAFSTFSLNVSDVSFKLAAASLEKGQMPEPASIRSEEFINAFNYRDPDAAPGVPIAFASERARYPFAHNRELLRFSLKTAAAGRQIGRPLNIVLLLDNSGSMERADRVRIIQEALRVLAGQLQSSDTFSIVTFARTATLRVDGVHGDQAAAAAAEIAKLTPEGGTNLGDALDLAYETALHHYLANGDNRVVLLTDGAANLGDVDPNALKQKVEAHRKQGVALDCFGIGWEDYNDDLLEVLTRNGDGRYGFINTPEEATTEFVAQIAGALHVAASDVKVQVEFNPQRVTSYRQIGYARHQLTKQQFRDNTVDAAEIAAQEAGNALYTIETNPQGDGSIATVRVRYKVPGTGEYREQAWDVPYTGSAVALEQASPAMRLATTASAFSEWLATSPFAGEVTTDQLLQYLNNVPKIYGADTRPAKLEWMIRQAKSISGK